MAKEYQEDWAEEEYRLSSMTTKGNCEPTSYIRIEYILWDKSDKNGESVATILSSHIHSLLDISMITYTDIKSYLPEEYRIIDICTYLVGLDPDTIPQFINTLPSESMDTHFRVYNNPTTSFEVLIPPTMFMFHSINTIYVLVVIPTIRKSILSTRKKNIHQHKHTKKRVSFY